MVYYPVFLNLSETVCLVVGGGTVAGRKVDSLLEAGGNIRLVSPELTLHLQALGREGRITVQQRLYQPDDLAGVSLVIAATDDTALQQHVAADAKQAVVLCNIVDQPGLCSFIVPAVIKQGDLAIAVSTSGASPALAKKICRDLAEQFGPEYALALQLLGRVRERIIQEKRTAEERRRLFTRLAESALLDYLRERRADKVNALLQQTLGATYTLESLDFSLDSSLDFLS